MPSLALMDVVEQLKLAIWIASLALTTFIVLAVLVWHPRLESLFPSWALRLSFLFLSLWLILLVLSFSFIYFLPSPPQGTKFLWYMNEETSVASVVTTMPLFLAATLCLAFILPSGKLSRLEWLYWFVLCLSFTIMALIEFVITPSELFWIPKRGDLFRPIGVLLAGSTLFMILRNNTAMRRLYLTALLAGMAVWTTGAIVIDDFYFRDSYPLGPLEETLELIGVLVTFLGIAGLATSVAQTLSVKRTIMTTCALLVVLLSGAVINYRYTLIVPHQNWDLPFVSRTYFEEILYAKRMDATIEDTLALTGWSYDLPQPGGAADFRLWLHATRRPDYPFGLAVQLLDQANGSVLAAVDKLSFDGDDKRSPERVKWPAGRFYTRSQAVELTLPADLPVNHAFWLTLSFWEYEGNVAIRPLPVDSSDYPLLGETHVILDEVVFPETVACASLAEAPGRFANGFVLQAASIPGRAQAGGELAVSFTWCAERDGSEDLIQFLHFFHAESGAYQVVDQMPLGARLPTRLWYAGLQSDETWQFTLPADLQAGRYSIFSGLYRSADLQRLDVTLANGTQPADARILLGSILVDG